MNIKNLTDQMLMQKTEGFVKEEREGLTRLLHHFREIERRRLYCDYKFKSLHKMLVGHFGYSDDEAGRRISAMHLLKEIPEVEAKIHQGGLTLSHLTLVQSFFRQEAKVQKIDISKEQKLEILEKINEQSIREAQRIVLSSSVAPEELRPDKVTVISEHKMEYRFTADKSLEDKMEQVKGLLAHKYTQLSLAELFEVLCEMGIETLMNQKTATSKKCSVKPAVVSHELGLKKATTEDATKLEKEKSFSQIKREVWQKDQCQCQNCGSYYALEIDHRLAKAKGGTNDKANLRVLCRACNQRSAIRQLGQHKMDRWLN